VVLTDDNPRTEDPARIRADVEEGLRGGESEYTVLPDRREAIAHALAAARAKDTVVLAGKGHERVQIVGEKKHFWDEKGVAEEILQEMGYAR
jgi:UDP-N-acetylmuramoyl-L-alanyl-D-glutamate--2,6-diaminopimelate ligase